MRRIYSLSHRQDPSIQKYLYILNDRSSEVKALFAGYASSWDLVPHYSRRGLSNPRSSSVFIFRELYFCIFFKDIFRDKLFASILHPSSCKVPSASSGHWPSQTIRHAPKFPPALLLLHHAPFRAEAVS